MRLKLALLLLLQSFCRADGLSQMESAVGTNAVEVIWNVPSNHWPTALWTYKVVPQNFAPPVISNLMAIGSFTKDDRAKSNKRPPFKDDGLLIFKNKENTRELVICPYLGWVKYRDDSALAQRKELPQGIPSEERAFELALDYLRLLAIDRSQLATKGDSAQLRIYKEVGHRGWFDKSKGTEINEVSRRGIFFIRRVDGIDFSGIGPLGGVCITFGNQAKVTELEVVWRGLEPSQLRKTVTAEEMAQAIRRGQTKWTPPLRNPRDLKKITVTEVMPFYRGAGGEDEQRLVEPFVLLATTVDIGQTNIVANLEFPILK